MLNELQMSKDRYYKHLKCLTDADYIRIERTKSSNGVFDKNVYTIVALPNPAPVAEEKVPESQKKPAIKKLKVKEKASVNELRERLDIDNLKICDPDHAEIIEDIFMAVEDMNLSEQISISGNVKKKEAIQNLLNQLTADNIRLVVQIMKKNKKPLINRKAYIQTCLVNSIFDVRSKNTDANGMIKEKQQEEEAEKKRREKEKAERRELLECYEKYPELKVLDQQITEVIKKMSRAVLCKNKQLVRKLGKHKEQLLKERSSYEKKINMDKGKV